ncbi:hypothetical protein GOA58_07030 [Sinorhizobium meliloti]|uniref:hypothetical protein n=1 Tax=Sinorhizobium TaxID=28105 RepID=UPI001297620C|nr:hypothetical protein [Sinorhizobium medicae]MDW9447443.1 hypothetical protein [Sinorhizobium meliloti]MDW9660332.1 hypothetical protein [Sinorhizobium meliloti]MDX0049901.1 hypothetical protein [Sinorhizobium meliloti]MQV98347.1 hypothetical protein [Sinorhizobium medicae]
MTIAESYGPLIESGQIDGFTYEVRGTTHPMVYVYRDAGGGFVGKATQKGGINGETVARMLMSELPKE